MKKIISSLIVASVIVSSAIAEDCKVKLEDRIAFGAIGVLQGIAVGGPIGAFWGLGAMAFADAYDKDCQENIVEKKEIIPNKFIESFVNFDFNKYNVKSVNVEESTLNISNAKNIIIEGHTDAKGSDEYNFALGLKRANAVKELLSKNISKEKLSVISYGETAPISKKDNENRRVDLKITYK